MALTLDQSSVPAHVVLAMINASQNRFDGALGEADKAVALDARHSRAWRERGRALYRLGRLNESEQAFRTAVTLDPDDWTARNGLGAALLMLKRLDEAISEFERIQVLTPDNTRAYNNLGSAFLQQERFDKATAMYERSLSLDKNPTAYSNLGTALYQQGLFADAARSFEGAVALPGAAFLHWFNLGAACYWAPELRARAKEAYETALKVGQPAQPASGRSDPVRLAELASSHAVLALLTEGSEQRGASEPRAQTPRAHRPADSRSARPLNGRDDLRGTWRSSKGPGMARAGDQGRAVPQQHRALPVVEATAGRRTIPAAASVTHKEQSEWPRNARTCTRCRA